MFNPTHLVFAPTAQCNLHCAHCRVDRTRGKGGSEQLTAADAISFMKQSAAGGIDRIGFSGGEPFLETEFLCEITRAAVDEGLYFDRLMTNGVWFTDETDLRQHLSALFDAGFDGTIGLSVDKWHAQETSRLVLFIRTIVEVFGRGDCLEIVSVLDDQGEADISALGALAADLNAKLEMVGKAPRRILDSRWQQNRERNVDDGSGLNITIVLVPRSAAADEEKAWQADRWFTDDYCAGPGNVFYVHPDGSVAVCCGFANENPDLIVGTVQDSYSKLMKSASANAHIRECYETGLAKKRQQMEAGGYKFPGKTDDICFFCDYLCKKTVSP